LNRLGDVVGLDLLRAGEIADRPADLKNANKDMLYTAHEYPDLVSVIPIHWEELATL
jgi:hypothetical protein